MLPIVRAVLQGLARARTDLAPGRRTVAAGTAGGTPPSADAVGPQASTPHTMPEWSADTALTDPGQDRFNRRPFAERLADAIVTRRDPASVVVGLYASWGAGKSTLLGFVAHELARRSNAVCLFFNPWLFSEPSALIRAFFDRLADAIETRLATPAEELGSWLRTYGPLLASVSLKVPGVEFTPGRGLTEVSKELEKATLEQLRDRITEALAAQPNRVVVFLDDVDRLDREEMQLLLKLVKLIAAFPNVVYVLALDEQLVSESIGERYGGGDERAGREFLEKIVQVPLPLPLPEPTALRMYCLERIGQVVEGAGVAVTEEQGTEYQMRFLEGLAPAITTPRTAVRYANALTFSLPLLQGEVNLIDFMLLEGMRLLYPRLYEVVRSRRDIMLGEQLRRLKSRGEESEQVTKAHWAVIDEGLTGLVGAEREAARKLLLTLFPRLNAAFGSHFSTGPGEEVLAREQCVASEAYFDRFFAYAVPEVSVSDVALQRLLSAAATEPPEVVDGLVLEMLAPQRAESFVERLRRQAKTMGPAAARNLIKALVRVGDRFPRPRTLFSFTTAFAQAGILIRTLLARLPSGATRLEAATEVLRTAQPLGFAAECFYWMRRDKQRPEAEQVVTSAEEQQLGQTLARRVEARAADGPLYLLEPRDGPGLLWIWSEWGTREDVTRHLRASFDRDPRHVLRFVEQFAPHTWSAAYVGPRRGDLTREGYNQIAHFIPPAEIYERLRALYGEALDAPQYDDTGDRPRDERLAHQVADIHHHVVEEARKQAQAAAATQSPDPVAAAEGGTDDREAPEDK